MYRDTLSEEITLSLNQASLYEDLAITTKDIMEKIQCTKKAENFLSIARREIETGESEFNHAKA